MSFQGDISSLSLCDVFQNLVGNKKTGTLSVHANDSDTHIQFQDGHIISYTDTRGFSVPQWLVDKEIVAQENLEEALKRYRRAKRKTLGEILRDLKLLDLEEYTKYVKYVVWESLCEALSFQEGSFTFRESDLNPDHGDREVKSLGLTFSASSLIMEAARRSDDWEQIRRHMPSEHEIYVISPSERAHLAEKAEDEITANTVELLDGSLTLSQVIAHLPYSRFEACRCIADLISRKKAKPLDSAQAVARSSSGRDPMNAIACLKTILEREPNNHEVLNKLASLYESQGLLEDSAKCTKMLAISYLESDDLQKAKHYLRKSLELNPKDIISWQKLWDCVVRRNVDEEIRSFGKKYVQHFLQLGLPEMARDRLIDLVQRFPERYEFRLGLADARFALGERKTAIQELSEYGEGLIEASAYDRAEVVFQRILTFDHSHERAQQVVEEIRSGKLEQRKELRRRVFHGSIVVACLLLGAGITIREVWVGQRVFEFSRTVFAESILEDHRYDDAIKAIRGIKADYPFSFTAAAQTKQLIEALEKKKAATDSNRQGPPSLPRKPR